MLQSLTAEFQKIARAIVLLRVMLAAAALGSLLGCGQENSGSEDLAARRQTQGTAPAQGKPGAKRSAFGMTEITLPSPAEVCAKRQQTVNAIIEAKSKLILEFCNRNSAGNCAERDQCLKGLLSRVDAGEIAVSLTVSKSLQESSLEQERTRQFLIRSSTQVNDASAQKGVTVFFGFKWTFGDAAKNSSSVVCVPPMETFRGKLFVRTLMNQLSQLTLQFESDACRLEVLDFDQESQRLNAGPAE
jgi:hypothetical protein